MNIRTLSVERPDTAAKVDFLHELISVTLTIEDGKLRIVTEAMNQETDSTWEKHEFEVPVIKEET